MVDDGRSEPQGGPVPPGGGPVGPAGGPPEPRPSGGPASANQAPTGPAVPAVRASDDERYRVVEALGEHAAAGRISLAELEERVARVHATTTRQELAELTRDLPAPTTERTTPAGPGERTRWLFAIMGGSVLRRTHPLARRVNAISLMGGDDLDLREMEILDGELTIYAFSVMGGLNVYVPDGVEVELTGLALLGGNDERGSGRPPRPGAPLVRVRSYALMGGVDVWRLPAESRGVGVRAARKAAKALERGSP